MPPTIHRPPPLLRREILTGAAALVACGASGGIAAPRQTFEEALRGLVGEAPSQRGRVTLEIPGLTENGNSVSISISVESPMTEADHVKAIYVLSEKNPFPDVARFHLGPRAGRAQVSTSIRLATSQRVLAVAQMSDGSFWSDHKDVIVTLGACVDGG